MTDPDYPPRRTPSARAADEEIVSSLRAMIETNETVTVRALVSRMESLRQPSTITRDAWRMARVAEAQAEQKALRDQTERWDKTSKTNLAAKVETQAAAIEALEADKALLRGGLVAVIKAIGENGGMRAWLKFFRDYDEAIKRFQQLEVVTSAEVVAIGSLPKGPKSSRRRR